MAPTSATESKQRKRPVILITGANAGLGFATCQRLLLQLSSTRPSDTLPKCPALYAAGEESLASPFAAPTGCTILLACRNAIKAHKARRALVELVQQIKALPDHVETPTSAEELAKYGIPKPTGARETLANREPDELVQGSDKATQTTQLLGVPQDGSVRRRPRGSKSSDSYEPRLDDDIEAREARARGRYRRRFCRGTRIEFVPLDLGSFASVLTCAKQVSERHSYLTHLILNAGGAAWIGLDFVKATFMILTSFQNAVTYPSYKQQRSGDLSQDGVGWVWSINVGGSWMLTQALLPLLQQSPYSTPSRIVWTSSIEALRKHFDLNDMQCLRTDVTSKAYESTKYQCELAALALEEQLEESPVSAGSEHKIQPEVYLTHPGVVATSIMADYLNWFTSAAMLVAFYIARWVGSPHHCISPYKGAIATCHVALTPRPGRQDPTSPPAQGVEESGDNVPAQRPFTRFASRCDRWGREYVDLGLVDGWEPETDGQGQRIVSSVDDVKGGEKAAAVAAAAETAATNVRGLASLWRRKADDVCRKVRRQSDAGQLPPAKVAKSSLSTDSGTTMWEPEDDFGKDEDEDSADELEDELESSEDWQKIKTSELSRVAPAASPSSSSSSS